MSSPPPCPHRPPCPGCPRYGDPTIAADARAALAALAESAGLPAPPIHSVPALGHRHRARLAVRGSAADPRLGLFEAGTHRVVATPDCAVHHPSINAAAGVLRDAIRETETPPYDEARHRGALRYVQLVVQRESERIQAVLVGCGESPGILGGLPEAFARRMGEQLQGLFFNAQPARSNVILGERTQRLAGTAAIQERIADVDVFYPPTAFGQNHLPLFERAVRRIGELVPPRARVAELYCGVGAIGLSLLARGASVDFNERSPGGLEGLALGLAARPAAERARALVYAGGAAETGTPVERADVVVVDPPRKGLDRPLLERLVDSPPARLVYLACDRASLARDLERLRASRRLVLRGVEAFDFFPYTEHVETLVWLDRAGEHFGSGPDGAASPATGIER